MGKGRYKRKGKAPDPLVGGLRSPSPTLSTLGSLVGELAFGISYDVAIKVPRTGVAESVADVAGVTRGMKVMVVGKSSLGTRSLMIISAVSLQEQFKRMLLNKIQSMMTLIEVLTEKASSTFIHAQKVLNHESEKMH